MCDRGKSTTKLKSCTIVWNALEVPRVMSE
jgi:hypothetical protein